MQLYRKTAIVEFVLFSSAEESTLPLATERDFGVKLNIENVTCPAQSFRSPINDEQWREFFNTLRECNSNRKDNMYRNATVIRSLGRHLYDSLAAVSPALRDFLGQAGDARRLVIQTTRPELHLLPWAAMVDNTGAFLAAGDLSVVQSWDPFLLSATQESTLGNTLTLMTAEGPNTRNVAGLALDALPREITRKANGQAWQDGLRVDQDGKPVDKIDILHLEAHGDAASSQIGNVYSTQLASTFPGVPIALLWSCCSGAANSWGESPALCLHRQKASLVLSFLAELDMNDASSISTAFYGDVFGPAASRDPEAALVRIRAAKFASPTEFPYANWASMTVYLRAPLDLSALPLNGPRVPDSQWMTDQPADATNSSPCAPTATAIATTDPNKAPPTDQPSPTAAATQTATPASATVPNGAANAAGQAPQTAPAASPAPSAPPSISDLWTGLATRIIALQPGTATEFFGFENFPAEATAKLPKSVFSAWRGNVIRLDGPEEPLDKRVLFELNISDDGMPETDAAERLLWFFNKIERYGSPLLVWTNADDRHISFLRNVKPSSTLTFLLIHGPQPDRTLLDLVDDYPQKAYEKCATLPENCGDDLLSAAYFACARCEDSDQAFQFIRRVASHAERWLLTANYISRHGAVPNPKPDWMLDHPDGKLTSLQQQHCQEDYLRQVITNPGIEAPERESGRAKQELGYLLKKAGKTGVAEMLYGQALSELGKCPPEVHDYRWHGAIGRLLRDWADLLASSPDRLDKARDYLARAMAIHSFHGRRLQIAYCLNTSARIELTDRRFSEAIDDAVDSANLFELLKNWRGWGEAMKILFDCLAETRETARMQSLADLGINKLQGSNLKDKDRNNLHRFLTYEKANANWIAGHLAEAKLELENLGMGATAGTRVELDSDFETEVNRLWAFLAGGRK
jgi:hypothetical protein